MKAISSSGQYARCRVNSVMLIGKRESMLCVCEEQKEIENGWVVHLKGH